MDRRALVIDPFAKVEVDGQSKDAERLRPAASWDASLSVL